MGEHQLIAQYCRSLNGDAGGGSAMGTSAPRSPVQLLAALDSNHKEEIETMIRELEEENANLQAEYERLRSQQLHPCRFLYRLPRTRRHRFHKELLTSQPMLRGTC